MNKPEFSIVEGIPPVEDYCRLRKLFGWQEIFAEEAQAGLKNSLYALYAVFENKMIGCGRVVGDGHIYFYLQDIMVEPSYQGYGLGHILTKKALDYIYSVAPRGAFVGLMAAQDKAAFYEKYGFLKRADDKPGMGFYIK